MAVVRRDVIVHGSSEQPNWPSGGSPTALQLDGSNTGVPSGTTLFRIPQDGTTVAAANSFLGNGTNTGWTYAGGTNVNVTGANAILDRLSIDPWVENNGNDDSGAAGVFGGLIVRKCKIRGKGKTSGQMLCLGDGALVEDCEIGDDAGATVVAGVNYASCNGIATGNWDGSNTNVSIIRRCNIHHITSQGIQLAGDTTIQDSWIHHNPVDDESIHSNGIFISAGNRNVMDNCRMGPLVGNTSYIFHQNNGGGNTPTGTLDVTNCFFDNVTSGGGSSPTFALYIQPTGFAGGTPARRITGNTFRRPPSGAVIDVPIGSLNAGSYVPAYTNGCALSGNVYINEPSSHARCSLNSGTDFDSP